jgi:bifunctional non-homologous end joining protein LigD
VNARARTARNASANAEAFSSRGAQAVVRQLDTIEREGGDGTLRVAPRRALHVSSLDKVFFPDSKITKGELMRYYASVSDVLLPAIKDRPLILKRYPNGIRGSSFFQQNAGEHLPSGVRTASIETESGADAERIIGGDLLTLLYTVQIGTIAVHAWQSRVRTSHYADTTTIDLDPGDRVPFKSVVRLANVIKHELDELGLVAGVKTSGSTGIHIVLPLPARTSFDLAAAVAAAIANRVARRNPKLATVERSLSARPRGSIYVDAQQNSAGKSVVAAYSVRERPGATVSAPVEWTELRDTLRLDTFTVKTMPARLRKVGDLWGAAMSRRNSKRALDRALRETSDGR